MARCGCGSSEGGTLVSGPNTVVTGTGTPANPYMIAAHTDCAEARACFTAGPGLTFDPVTGTFQALVSPAAGNTLTASGSGLFVPSSSVVTGPGLVGSGTAPDPLMANVAAWPYPTSPVSGAQGVFVDPATGRLVGAPVQVADFVTSSISRTYADLAVSTSSTPVTADTFVFSLANPDPNRSCIVVIVREVKVRFGLPANSTASFSMDGVDCGRQWNMGSAVAASAGVTMTKMFKSATLGPGATSSYSLVVGTLNGTGSASYNRIDTDVRVLYISQ